MTCPACSWETAPYHRQGLWKDSLSWTPVLNTLHTGVTTAAVTSLQGRSMVKCHCAAAASGAPRLWSVYGAECHHGGLEQSLGASSHLLAERVWRKAVAFMNKQKVIGWALSNTFKWDQFSFLLLLVRHRRKLIGLKTFHAVSLTRWMCPISEMKSE